MWQEVVGFIAVPIIRSVAGWLQKSLEDGRIQNYEVKKLFETIVRLGTIQLFAYYGFSIVGIDNAVLASGIAAFFADKLFGSLKENKPVRR